jgi:hypothetical protein
LWILKSNFFKLNIFGLSFIEDPCDVILMLFIYLFDGFSIPNLNENVL